MGLWDDLTGKSGAAAARNAAADTYGKQQSAIGRLLGYGNEYAADFEGLSKAYDPYVQTGYATNDALRNLIENPSSVRGLPGYQFAQDEGIKALDRSAAARHMPAGGRASKDLLRYATGYADQTYGNQLARLMGLQGQGMGAVGAQNATMAQGLQGQLGTRTTAYGGDMTSAGTIGQGDIAAANAQAAGSQNLLNAGLKIAGMAAAPFTGGASLGLLMGGGGGGGGGGGNPMWGGGINKTNSNGWF